ncbi:hypothetical protein EVAR_22365_1 [Eumeta japonica]|uniref:Uncharacterized protein n=1 Tax=Eumeta variegata TaxID=151549 RepID=A0A4C1VIE0_EUMVA|nr:hypothetical protein EVAR_22365_1 [Eumeta japonica]
MKSLVSCLGEHSKSPASDVVNSRQQPPSLGQLGRTQDPPRILCYPGSQTPRTSVIQDRLVDKPWRFIGSGKRMTLALVRPAWGTLSRYVRLAIYKCFAPTLES